MKNGGAALGENPGTRTKRTRTDERGYRRRFVPAVNVALHRVRPPSSVASAFIRVLCLWVACGTAFAITVTDDLGRKVELKAPAQRIVTLAPFLTELAYSAGAGARVVAASAYSDYPEQAKALPHVASAAGPEIEPIAALTPDLVLAWEDSIRREDVERIERLGIAVFVARAKRLDDPPRLAETIARLAGTDAAGPARAYRERMERARVRDARPRVRAFVEVWHKPLTTIGARHWINEALALCGAENVFADLPQVAPMVSWEEVYRRDPDAIVGTPAPGREGDFIAAWRDRSTLRAVAGSRFVFVDPDRLQRPTLRLADGVAALCAGVEGARKR
jgi:iron complex transport system substrate-binding protein